MSFFTSVNSPPSTIQIRHADQLLTMGSCFAASMNTNFQQRGFMIESNPNGIIYHPLVLIDNLKRIAFGEAYELRELEQNKNELWHSWQHHGSFSHPNKELALTQMNASLIAVKSILPQLDWLIITFGTAYGYRLQSTGNLVANCHKYPANHFSKELTEAEVMIEAYSVFFEQIKRISEKLKIILTVSPIRHIKEGLINNNRSKARLLLLAEKLEQKFDYCHYFPAYEYLMDELRDYRFFDSDLVHPSAVARDFIWEKFSNTYFNAQTKKINTTLMGFHKAAAHRPLFPDSIAHQQFLKQQAQKLDAFEASHPEINISAIKNKLAH